MSDRGDVPGGWPDTTETTMSILDRLNRLVRSNISDAADRTGETLRSALDDMESSLREARRQQAEMRRTERDLINDIRERRDEADEWEERAMMALQNDDEDLAREALKEKNRAMHKAEQLREELRAHRSHMEDISASLDALEQKLQGQKQRLEGDRGDKKLTSDRGGGRSRRRDASDRDERDETATPYDDVFDTDEKMETFDRMAGKINSMEAEIEAMRELSDIGGGDSRRDRLERIFRKMESKADRGGREEKNPDERDGREERDDLSGMKSRMDRLSELKDKFGDEEDED